jgi:hypothetical protein
VDVVAVEEIRWGGKGRIKKKKYFSFLHGPKQKTGRYWTGFIINAK